MILFGGEEQKELPGFCHGTNPEPSTLDRVVERDWEGILRETFEHSKQRDTTTTQKEVSRPGKNTEPSFLSLPTEK